MPEPEPLTELDDEEFALRIMEKDGSALATVLKVYGPRVKGHLRTHFGDTLDCSERDYVFQQATINLWDGIGTFDPTRGGMRGWFIRIARNAAISHIRGEKKHRGEPLGDPADDHADECGDVSLPADAKEQKRLDRIHDFINNKLVGIEKIVALNCFAVGGDPDSVRIAAKIGRSRSYVDTVKSKVKKKIRDFVLALEAEESKRKDKK